MFIWAFSDTISGMLQKVLKHNRAMVADGTLLSVMGILKKCLSELRERLFPRSLTRP